MKSQIPSTKSQANPKSQCPKIGHWSLVIGHFSKGFTLIEAVVSVSVFAVAITSIVGVYLSLQRLNQASASLQALQQNARFISEDMSKLIRNGQIHFSRYPPGALVLPETNNLYVIDRDGAEIAIYEESNALVIDKLGIGKANFSSREVKVKDFKVFIWPSADPFPGGTQQPTVTVYFELESNVNSKDRIRVPFQLTVATREYPE